MGTRRLPQRLRACKQCLRNCESRQPSQRRSFLAFLGCTVLPACASFQRVNLSKCLFCQREGGVSRSHTIRGSVPSCLPPRHIHYQKGSRCLAVRCGELLILGGAGLTACALRNLSCLLHSFPPVQRRCRCLAPSVWPNPFSLSEAPDFCLISRPSLQSNPSCLTTFHTIFSLLLPPTSPTDRASHSRNHFIRAIINPPQVCPQQAIRTTKPHLRSPMTTG